MHCLHRAETQQTAEFNGIVYLLSKGGDDPHGGSLEVDHTGSGLIDNDGEQTISGPLAAGDGDNQFPACIGRALTVGESTAV